MDRAGGGTSPRDAPGSPEPAPRDVASLDAIVAALYEAVSFAPNAVPDWDRLADRPPTFSRRRRRRYRTASRTGSS